MFFKQVISSKLALCVYNQSHLVNERIALWYIEYVSLILNNYVFLVLILSYNIFKASYKYNVLSSWLLYVLTNELYGCNIKI